MMRNPIISVPPLFLIIGYCCLSAVIEAAILAKPAVCDQLHPVSELRGRLHAGDIITIRKPAGQESSSTRSFIYAGGGKIVFIETIQQQNAQAKHTLVVLGTIDELLDNSVEGCLNANDQRLIYHVEDPNEIAERALMQVGRTDISNDVTDFGLTGEEHLANAARYGKNLSYIEKLIGQSSLQLKDGVNDLSLALRNEISGLFGKFAEDLMNKTLGASSGFMIDSLSNGLGKSFAASSSLGGSSGLGTSAGSGIGTSLGSGLGTSLGGRRRRRQLDVLFATTAAAGVK